MFDIFSRQWDGSIIWSSSTWTTRISLPYMIIVVTWQLVTWRRNIPEHRFSGHDDVIKWKHIPFRVTGPLCGNSLVTGEFPSKRPVMRSFDVFFDLRLNKRFSKQSRRWLFETPSRSLWRHCNAGMFIHEQVMAWMRNHIPHKGIDMVTYLISINPC